jgi:hypothetical protein
LAKEAFLDLTRIDQVAKSGEFRHTFWKYTHIAGFSQKYGK